MATRRLVLSGLVSLSVAVGGLMFLSMPAFAFVEHPFLAQLTGSGTPAGGFLSQNGGPDSLKVAVDDSAGASAGDVYVVDSAAGVVDEFSPGPDSKYLCQITGAGSATMTIPSGSECDPLTLGTPSGSLASIEAVAVDPGTGDLYVVTGQVVEKFSATGEYKSEISGLYFPYSVAVDKPTGDVYIGSNENGIYEFEPSSSSLKTFATETPNGPLHSVNGVAVDSSGGPSAGDVYAVVGHYNESLKETEQWVYKFNAKGEYQSEITPPSGSFDGTELSSVAVDSSSGDVYVADQGTAGVQIYHGNGFVDQFDPSGVFLGQISAGETPFGLMEPTSVALSVAGEVYLTDARRSENFNDHSVQSLVDVFGPGEVLPDVTTGLVSEIEPTSATLEGAVDPDGTQLTECYFEYGTGTLYGQSAPCVPAAGSIASDQSNHPVSAHLTDLERGTVYHFRLVAVNANGASYGQDASFPTLPPPSIDSAVATNVTLESADLTAKIDPNGYDTTYRTEWGTSTAYGEILPASGEEDIGAGTSDVVRSWHLSGLHADTLYHWRVVATNVNGATVGADHTFIYSTSGSGLPDGRQYEMVSPPHKNGALLSDVVFLAPYPEISEDGSRLIATSIQCFGDATSCTALRVKIGSFYAFSRTPNGWVTSALAPPVTQFRVVSALSFNADSGMALFGAPTEPFGEDDFYARQPNGTLIDIGPVAPPSEGQQISIAEQGDLVTSDYSHLVFEDERKWGLVKSTGDTLYEYVGSGNSQPFAVGVSGERDSTSLISACATATADGPGALSTDGRTVYFVAERCAGGSGVNSKTAVPASELYARVDGEMADAHTVAISQRSPSECTGACHASVSRNAIFASASADGSKVYFTSPQQLTNDATNGQNNLYLYDLDNPEGHNLIDVSAGDSSGAGPRVEGVLTVSSDGSHVYFAAQGVLTHGPNSQGQVAVNGGENLYVYERDAAYPNGRIAFITHGGVPLEGRSLVAANVTPDGRFLVFTSSGRLTADDASMSGAEQVFRYDAQTGELTRISIGNDGFNDNGNGQTRSLCYFGECSENAHIVWPKSAARRDPTMSNDGAYVFFDSSVGLTPQALNDVLIAESDGRTYYAQNVYEWHEGHVYLISDGRDVTTNEGTPLMCGYAGEASSVCLFGTDATGSNVFFSTADQLVPADTDTELDYYDARICTSESPCIKQAPPPLPPCLGEACHGRPAATPSLLTPGSATFNGEGNIISAVPPPKKLTKKTVKCKKGFVKNKQSKCVRKKSKKKRKATSHKGGK